MSKRGRETEYSRSCIAFDIDGVFKYGREWSKDGSKALEKVTKAGMPFVFVTNGGGGLTETSYAASMTSKIAGASKADSPIVIGPERMVLSYTPWKTLLCEGLADSRVLLIGDPREKVLEVAHNYGLKHATHYQDYAIKNDTINPFRAAKAGGTSHTAVAVASGKETFSGKEKVGTPGRTASPAVEEPFAAILVMCDPYEWCVRAARAPSRVSWASSACCAAHFFDPACRHAALAAPTPAHRAHAHCARHRPLPSAWWCRRCGGRRRYEAHQGEVRKRHE